MSPRLLVILLILAAHSAATGRETPPPLLAGAARIDITHPDHPSPSCPLRARALAFEQPENGRSALVIAIDVVALAEIGPLRDPFLARVRSRIEESTGIPADSIIVNASHCHGIPCEDVEDRVVAVAEEAWSRRVAVRSGAGAGHEDRISENRRLELVDGGQADVRHAYAMPADEDVAAVGPIDPEIGVLRLDRADEGTPLAVVFQFACHPIQGVPGGGNTPDLTGFAAQVIEENLGPDCIALFLQGCAGDINPAHYKTVDRPRDAEYHGNRLGLATLKAARAIETRPGSGFHVRCRSLPLPRADLSERIAAMESELDDLLDSLRGTSLNLKTFLPLYVKYHLFPDAPSHYRHRYLQDESIGREDWNHLDAVNRKNLEAYLANIRTMEEMTRLQINLALLEKHQARNAEANMQPVEAELMALRVGDFRLVTFPGEVTVPVGLAIKGASPHRYSFVSGYTNGYLYYAPTAAQLLNRGGAQEDSDCLLAPGWEKAFTAAALELFDDR